MIICHPVISRPRTTKGSVISLLNVEFIHSLYQIHEGSSSVLLDKENYRLIGTKIKDLTSGAFNYIDRRLQKSLRNTVKFYNYTLM